MTSNTPVRILTTKDLSLSSESRAADNFSLIGGTLRKIITTKNANRKDVLTKFDSEAPKAIKNVHERSSDTINHVVDPALLNQSSLSKSLPGKSHNQKDSVLNRIIKANNMNHPKFFESSSKLESQNNLKGFVLGQKHENQVKLVITRRSNGTGLTEQSQSIRKSSEIDLRNIDKERDLQKINSGDNFSNLLRSGRSSQLCMEIEPEDQRNYSNNQSTKDRDNSEISQERSRSRPEVGSRYKLQKPSTSGSPIRSIDRLSLKKMIKNKNRNKKKKEWSEHIAKGGLVIKKKDGTVTLTENPLLATKLSSKGDYSRSRSPDSTILDSPQSKNKQNRNQSKRKRKALKKKIQQEAKNATGEFSVHKSESITYINGVTINYLNFPSLANPLANDFAKSSNINNNSTANTSFNFQSEFVRQPQETSAEQPKAKVPVLKDNLLSIEVKNQTSSPNKDLNQNEQKEVFRTNQLETIRPDMPSQIMENQKNENLSVDLSQSEAKNTKALETQNPTEDEDGKSNINYLLTNEFVNKNKMQAFINYLVTTGDIQGLKEKLKLLENRNANLTLQASK